MGTADTNPAKITREQERWHLGPLPSCSWPPGSWWPWRGTTTPWCPCVQGKVPATETTSASTTAPTECVPSWWRTRPRVRRSGGPTWAAWEMTGQTRWDWSQSICRGANPGDSWCICMWAAASLVAQVGCDNTELNCAATDVEYVLRSRTDGGWNLRQFKSCLRRKCARDPATGRWRDRV